MKYLIFCFLVRINAGLFAVVYEHKSRLERAIQDEKDHHHKTKEGWKFAISASFCIF